MNDHRTPERYSGIRRTTLEAAPTLREWVAGPGTCWVTDHEDVTVWPVGELTREGRDGVLVVVRSGGLSLMDADTRLAPIWGPVAIGLDELATLSRQLRIAEASCAGEQLTIGYLKQDAAQPEMRRIGRIVPSEDGAGIVCADLDKDAPRRFNLHRIVSVVDA